MADTMRDRMVSVVSDLMATDPQTALILADISKGQFRTVFQKYPQRAINVGIMEQTAISLAAGFALEGFTPIVHTIAPFLVERPYEQIKDDFIYQDLPGIFISIGASYDYGDAGMTHQCPGDVLLMKSLPGMQVCVPGTADEFDILLRQTHQQNSATYLRTSTQQNATSQPVQFGQLHVVQEGKNGVVVTVGPMLDRTLDAVTGMDMAVLYATTVAPFDALTLHETVIKTAPNVMVIEPYYAGTLVPDIANALQSLPIRILAIGTPHRVLDRYGTPAEHDRAYGLTAQAIRTRIKAFMNAEGKVEMMRGCKSNLHTSDAHLYF